LCSQESGRAFRWSKNIVHWALTLQFHGGKRVIGDLRGKGFAGAGQHGDLKVDVKKWGLFLPADSTLRNYLPPVDVYGGFNEAAINQFKKAFPDGSPRKVLVAWDEIEIRYGLVWNPSTKELIGKVNGPIAEKSAKRENWIGMNSELATHVIQFFLVSIDGAASVPIGFYPMVSINGEKVFNLISPLLEQLQAGPQALEVVATASDAFPSNAKLIELLKKKGFKIVHLFDPLHLVKNMRNNIFGRALTSSNIEFGLNTLADLISSEDQETRRLFKSLHSGTVFPKDQMDLAPIRKLLSDKLIITLKKYPEEGAQKLGEYLGFMRLFDQSTTDNDMDNNMRISNLKTVITYLKTLRGLTSGLVQQVSTTIGSIEAIFLLSQKEGDEFQFRVSVLGTIVVENYFSTVRSKCRYPNLWEYAVFSRRAYFELIKNNADDYLFSGPKKGEDSWKKYGNQRGIDFSISQITLMSKKEKKELSEDKKTANGGTQEDLEFCQDMGREYRCKRRRMTIREISSKDSPFQSKAKIEMRVRCPVKGCHKNYKREGDLANHLSTVHNSNFYSIEAAQSAAHTAYEAAFNRALRARAEDHGFVPHQPEETHMDFEIDGEGLPLGDPDRLEEGEIEEEEELSGFAPSSSLLSLLQPTTSLSSQPLTTAEWDELLKEDLTPEMLGLWDHEALEEYQIDPVIVAHIQQHQLTLQLAPAFPQALHQPQGQPQPPAPILPPLPPMSLAAWVAAAERDHPDYPPPLPLDLGQSVRPVLIDFECGDFKHLEPIEMTVKCLITGRVFTTLIKCEHPIHFKAWQVHGISRRMLQYEPPFRAAYDMLLEWLAGMNSDPQEIVVFVAHNAAFDLRVMRKALADSQIPFPGNWIFHDSIKMIKQHRHGLPSYALGKLADTLQCVNKPTHRSASDVRCLAEILHKIFGPQLSDVAKGVARCVFGV
jgi:DNA polymerase III epsilon subunit-like protein